MAEYITKGQAVDAAYRAIHYGFNDVHKAMMEGKDLKVNADNFYYTLLENVRAEIAVAPPDDVVEVVRCENCRYFTPQAGWGGGQCSYLEDKFELPEVLIFDDDYCSDGERKDGGESGD